MVDTGTTIDPTKRYTPNEAAPLIGLTGETVRARIKSGELEAEDVGRGELPQYKIPGRALIEYREESRRRVTAEK